jgi:uncharacterized protein
MSESNTGNNAVISRIIQRPHKNKIQVYENWLKEIIPVVKKFEGHRGTNIIRPHGNHEEYTIVLHFESEKTLSNWLSSGERKNLIEKVRPFLSEEEQIEITTGLEFWFTPKSQKAAPIYKQFLITLSAIYPLTIIIPLLLSPLFTALEIENYIFITKFFVAIAIVLLMVYVIMPRYVKLVARWLYK